MFSLVKCSPYRFVIASSAASTASAPTEVSSWSEFQDSSLLGSSNIQVHANASCASTQNVESLATFAGFLWYHTGGVPHLKHLLGCHFSVVVALATVFKWETRITLHQLLGVWSISRCIISSDQLCAYQMVLATDRLSVLAVCWVCFWSNFARHARLHWTTVTRDQQKVFVWKKKCLLTTPHCQKMIVYKGPTSPICLPGPIYSMPNIVFELLMQYTTAQ